MYGSSKSKMGKSPKAKKDGSPKKAKAGVSKADWKKMPKNKQGVITYDTIKKTRAAKSSMK